MGQGSARHHHTELATIQPYPPRTQKRSPFQIAGHRHDPERAPSGVVPPISSVMAHDRVLTMWFAVIDCFCPQGKSSSFPVLRRDSMGVRHCIGARP